MTGEHQQFFLFVFFCVISVFILFLIILYICIFKFYFTFKPQSSSITSFCPPCLPSPSTSPIHSSQKVSPPMESQQNLAHYVEAVVGSPLCIKVYFSIASHLWAPTSWLMHQGQILAVLPKVLQMTVSHIRRSQFGSMLTSQFSELQKSRVHKFL